MSVSLSKLIIVIVIIEAIDQVPWIAVILQHEIQNTSTDLIVALELGYLKGSYVNFGLVF